MFLNSDNNTLYFCFHIVHGNWSEWSYWSKCSVTCGSGMKERSRKCDNPTPAYGGQNCTGNEFNLTSCDNEACPGKSYYR